MKYLNPLKVISIFMLVDGIAVGIPPSLAHATASTTPVREFLSSILFYVVYRAFFHSWVYLPVVIVYLVMTGLILPRNAKSYILSGAVVALLYYLLYLNRFWFELKRPIFYVRIIMCPIFGAYFGYTWYKQTAKSDLT
jgi:hypothetical protein